ncbi:anoctamin-4-like isoform X2 [Orbicella faveolata]|nr:anoctamin-4-like isoform X2 [Orbicella faveolata]
MEEILLQNRSKESTRSVNANEISTKIDYVLVYSEPESGKENDEEEKEKAEIREKYEENLKKQGLMVEHVTSDEQENVVFVLIHAPWDVLAKCAEEMMIRVPVSAEHQGTRFKSSSKKRWLKKAKNVLNIFQVQDDSDRKTERPVTAFFSRAKSDCFLIEDRETFFSDIDRSRMTHRLLLSTKYSSEMDDFGISRLLYKGAYTVAYPLHEDLRKENEDGATENERQRLCRNWASFSQWYKYQPLTAVKKYFGTRVAFYFAWLGTYNFMLVIAALVGLWCFVAGLITVRTFTPVKEICDKNNSQLFYMCPLCDKDCSYWTLTKSCDYAKVTHLFDHEGTVFFAVFMSLWATVFLEVWRRRQISLAYEWDMLHFEEEFEPPRPAFVTKAQNKKPNPVTGKLEPYIPFSLRAGKFTCGFMIVSFMVLLVIATLVGVVIYRAAMVAVLSAYPDEDVQQGARIITSLTASVLNLLAITVLGLVYEKIAVALTEWETPRTRTEYHNILTLKLFSFQFVNMYSSLFYIAFFKNSHIIGYPGNYNRIAGGRMEGCDPSGCFIELCIQLAVIMVGKQFINSISKFAVP